MATVWHHPPVGHAVMVAGFPAQHWVLQLIADFSLLQASVEMAVERKMSLHAPALAEVVHKRYLRRLSDEDRWSLVKALAKDCDYDGEMRTASDAFWQCKRVRDLFAHRSDLPLVRESGGVDYFYLVSSDVAGPVPSPLTPAVVRQLGANCRWLRALVEHLASKGGVQFASFVAGYRADGSLYLPAIELLPPPPLPVEPDWEPLELSREVGESDIAVRQPENGRHVRDGAE